MNNDKTINETAKDYIAEVMHIYNVPMTLTFKLSAAAIIEASREVNRSTYLFSQHFANKHELTKKEDNEYKVCSELDSLLRRNFGKPKVVKDLSDVKTAREASIKDKEQIKMIDLAMKEHDENK